MVQHRESRIARFASNECALYLVSVRIPFLAGCAVCVFVCFRLERGVCKVFFNRFSMTFSLVGGPVQQSVRSNPVPCKQHLFDERFCIPGHDEELGRGCMRHPGALLTRSQALNSPIAPQTWVH